ncbi:5-formyltetrahydrofolate cyclo-ligase [Acetobacter sp. LMG 1627]|uniref:5-formyltetrahydrofolate cyclo-ligase n=2 Tax=Acetobacter conturbans TaxID=1737472 RepID=A0ABX0JY42_9PROT|nr:5-formyltetrahydrofolate cyclo-ligase [Acetobacter conturbans]
MTHSGDLPGTVHEKRAIRAAMRDRLVHVPPATSRHLCERLASRLLTETPACIACVWPLPGEVDLRPLCEKLHQHDWRVLIPETPPKGSPLIFRQWRPEAEMKQGRFGTSYPDGPVSVPDVILVPMVAFDRRGYRLGYGGGYYDRTLARLPGSKPVGYAFSAQEVAEVPVGPFDMALPIIITENEDIIRDMSSD